MQKARWSSAVAAAALLAMPVAGSAQTTQSTPQQNPPAQEQPSGQADASAAKTHLSEARDTLSQITSMPEAAKLQGDARAKVSAVISDFNALITTQSDWRSAYAKVDADLTAALGPESDTNASAASQPNQPNQPVGTSGSTAPTPATGAANATGTNATGGNSANAGAQIDPAIRAKLVEFRTHLKEFEQAAGGTSAPTAASGSNAVNTSNGANASDPANAAAANPASATAAGTAGASGTTPPSVATGSTANPAQPGQPQPTGTSGVSPASPTANMDPADRTKAESAVSTGATAGAPNADAQKELDAISAILSKSRTGTLTKAQTTQLKKHVETLRVLLAQK